METETRYQRIAREQRERQAARKERMATLIRRNVHLNRALGKIDRNADRIDGYDRDDLGESPDY